MRIALRIRSDDLRGMRRDLERPHPFAAERVGFLTAAATATADSLLLLVRGYSPVDDADYVDDRRVGAAIGSEAFRKAIERAYLFRSALIHVHAHGHSGKPQFSGVDVRSGSAFVPSFFNTTPTMPQGMVVLSDDDATGWMWLDEAEDPIDVAEFSQVGIGYDRNWSAR